ncbi:RDD family protein [Luteimonas deserti]|uniref:RDD family protein n=1 Tax=Luteimonas deserti TaxID=2752306 RepID=A0A7Z0TTZ3_9GAMM|nr:RDD family protein [Luteimonas deserti]NYZ62331.1 RDD family protein [Luteimonas deserti]
MTHWYYADASNARQGPLAATELLGLRQAGRIGDETLVWRDGLDQWQPLRTLAHELDTAGAPAPPPDAWTLEPVAPSGPEPVEDAAGPDAWRPLTERDGAAIPEAWAQTASPYAAPTAPVDRADAVVQGGEIVYAGFLKRVAASIIDSLIVGVAGLIVNGLLGAVLVGLLGASGMLDATWFVVLQVVFQLLAIAIAATYYAWFHASSSMATPGKMAIGIKVVRSDGARISLARAVGRYFATILSGLPLGIGFLMAAFTARKQTLHDMVCDTLVVDTWAFTEHPERQRRELGTITLVMLVIFGVLATLTVVFFTIAILAALFAG